MVKLKKPKTRYASVLGILWRTPLYAIPFALFFALLNNGFKYLLVFYEVSLVFAYCNALAMWGVRLFLDTRKTRAMVKTGPAGGRIAITSEITLFVAAVVLASALASVIVHYTFVSGFLSRPREIAIMLLFALMFGALFLGVSYATHFYGEALARARSEEELNLARRIQRSFLLSSFPQRAGLEVHALNVSSKQVSGDFYDVVPAEGGFLLCIADVSGKGVPAALLSSMLQASLRTQAPLLQPVGAMISNVNGLLCQGVANGQFATMFLARIDEARMTLQYVNAGHNPPILVRADGSRALLEKGGPMVGIIDEVPFEQAEVALSPGDRIVLYTDGVSEAMNSSMEMYGDDRVGDLAASLPRDESAQQTIDSILGAVRGFLAGEEPQDDMTLMVVRVLGSPLAAGAPATVALPAAAPATLPAAR